MALLVLAIESISKSKEEQQVHRMFHRDGCHLWDNTIVVDVWRLGLFGLHRKARGSNEESAFQTSS
jgi:hypothetical protein